MATSLPIAEMARAVRNRDKAYHGLFCFAVRTTGIFCRPGCPARLARPENVEFFPGPREALGAGYRPCKRCRPLEEDPQPPWAAALLAEVAASPGLRLKDSELRARGLDPGTVRRHFQKTYGMTFQAYARARRLAGALAGIRAGSPVDDVVFGSGYESHSGFRAAFTRVFGQPPARARAKAAVDDPGDDLGAGAGEGVLLGWISSPLGPLVTGATAAGVCLLEFSDPRLLESQLQQLRRRFPGPLVPGRNRHLARLEAELAEYFAGRRREFTVPVVTAGTPFQERVWRELRRIPYGETRSYADLARALGASRAVRAVGRANATNRLLIVIPCHRVVNQDGGLGGYAGGRRRKEFLLHLEQDAIRQSP